MGIGNVVKWLGKRVRGAKGAPKVPGGSQDPLLLRPYAAHSLPGKLVASRYSGINVQPSPGFRAADKALAALSLSGMAAGAATQLSGVLSNTPENSISRKWLREFDNVGSYMTIPAAIAKTVRSFLPAAVQYGSQVLGRHQAKDLTDFRRLWRKRGKQVQSILRSPATTVFTDARKDQNLAQYLANYTLTQRKPLKDITKNLRWNMAPLRLLIPGSHSVSRPAEARADSFVTRAVKGYYQGLSQQLQKIPEYKAIHEQLKP